MILYSFLGVGYVPRRVCYAEEIVEKGGDYLLAVKDNQQSLANSVQEALSETINRKLEPGQLTIEQGHGRIETRQYCVLDATMSEDNCQIYRDNGAENLACLRHIVLNMLRAESTKLSIRLKQKRAWMKNRCLESVLIAGFNKIDKS